MTSLSIILFPITIFVTLFFITTQAGYCLDLSGEVRGEVRAFPYDSSTENTHHQNLSFSIEPTIEESWTNKTYNFKFTPFGRVDEHDSRRTHFDIRELSLDAKYNQWELKGGISRINWGVNSSFHIVDIINQLDLIEHPVWQKKLGQPMIHLRRDPDPHGVEFFILPGFRERPYAGKNARIRFTPRVDTTTAVYEDGRKDHVDSLVRYIYEDKQLSMGLYQFWGRSRDPSFLVEEKDGETLLIPEYPLIQQTGLNLKHTYGDFTTKIEAISREGQEGRWFATISGGEYRIKNIAGSEYDLGILAEYHYADSKDALVTTPFENDLFAGFMWYFNDPGDGFFAAGDVIDMDTPSQSIVLMYQKKLAEKWKIAAEYRGIVRVPTEDPIYSLRRDDFFQIELIYSL